jgi:hypothetical protein
MTQMHIEGLVNKMQGVEDLSPCTREFDIRIRYDIKEAEENGRVPI